MGNKNFSLSFSYLVHEVVLEAELVEQLGAAVVRCQGGVGDDDGLFFFFF